MRPTSMIFLMLLACGDKDAGDDTGDGGGDGGSADGGSGDGGADAGSSDGGSGDGGSGDGGSGDGETPVIDALDAWCYPHTVGDKDFVWRVEAQVSDPQGDVSFAPYFDGITVLDGSSEVAVYPMTCDGEGLCFGNFTESQDGVRCTLASAYTVRVQVLDEDDNWSAPVEVTGRMCDDSEPC